jgi:hypothetical protein
MGLRADDSRANQLANGTMIEVSSAAMRLDARQGTGGRDPIGLYLAPGTVAEAFQYVPPATGVGSFPQRKHRRSVAGIWPQIV